MREDFKGALRWGSRRHFLKKKKKTHWGCHSESEGEGEREEQRGRLDLTAPRNAQRISSRDEKNLLWADNICFILKVAKESSSRANIVPVQNFRASLLRGVHEAGIKACQIHPAPFAFRYQSIALLPGMANALPSLARTGCAFCLLSLLVLSLPPRPPLANSPSLPNKRLIRKTQTDPRTHQKISRPRKSRV